MTISTTTTFDEYTGNASTTVFAYTSRIFAASDLQVYVSGVLQTLTTHYTVSGVGTSTGGNVTFVTAPANNAPVRIVKAVPYTQTTDYVENDPFPAASFEDALDKLTFEVQQVKEITDRAPKFLTSSSVRNITFPEGASAADRQNKVVRWNSTGTDLVVTAAGSLGTLVAGVDVFTQRTITGDSNITIANGDGVSANPTVKWGGMVFAAAGTTQASRHMLNVQEGSGISVAIQDNAAGTGRADLYISARGIAIGKSGTPVATRLFLNFNEGTNTNVSVVNNAAGTGRVDVTISATGGVTISGTPVNKQLGIWTDASTQKGHANLAFDNNILFVGSGSTTNAKMTTGVTINQGVADAEMISLKASGVAHGVTGQTETDTFAFFSATDTAVGGLKIGAFLEAAGTLPAFLFRGGGGTEQTTASTTAAAFFMMDGRPISGTGFTNAAANSLIFGVQSQVGGSVRALFFVDAEGDLFVDGSTTITAFDAWDDPALARAFDLVRTPDHVIRSAWDEHVRYNRDDLMRAGILTTPQDGSDPMVNVTQLQRLHNGAIWQLHTQQLAMQERLALAESRLAALMP